MRFRINGILYMTDIRERGASGDMEIRLTLFDLDNEKEIVSGAWLKENGSGVDVDLYIRGLIMAIGSYFDAGIGLRSMLLGGFNVRMKKLIEDLGGEIV